MQIISANLSTGLCSQVQATRVAPTVTVEVWDGRCTIVNVHRLVRILMVPIAMVANVKFGKELLIIKACTILFAKNLQVMISSFKTLFTL